jgi:beta-galactosidase
VLSIPLYQRLLGANASAREVVDLAAYLWAGLTEYWRAHRTYAGVLCFTYLTASHRDAYTGDFFQDLENLKLQPGLEEALSNAFSPVGVYLNFWQAKLKAGATRPMAVSLVNDEYEAAQGKLVVSVAAGGKVLVQREMDVEVAPLGQQTYVVNLPIPSDKGLCEVTATLRRAGSTTEVVSRRRSVIE